MKIQVRDLFKKYYIPEKKTSFLKSKTIALKALNNVNFTIEEGEICGLIGLNGAGKSTLIKILCGVLQQSGGEVDLFLEGEKITLEELKKNMSVIFGHRGQLWPNLDVIDSYKILGAMYEVSRENLIQRIKWLDSILDLEEFLYRPARQLSLGQKMKCELAGSLLNEPKLLLLDEPTLGLDILTKQKMFEAILKIHKKLNNTIIFTSHDLRDIGDLCNQIVILNKGEIIFNNHIEVLYDTFVDEYLLSINSPTKKTTESEIQNLLKDFNKRINKIELLDSSLFVYIDKTDNTTPFKIMEILEKHLSPKDINLTTIQFEEIIKNIYSKGETK